VLEFRYLRLLFPLEQHQLRLLLLVCLTADPTYRRTRYTLSCAHTLRQDI
jgi:hypothetical protein